MSRIPMTAKEQLETARELGHELSVLRRDFPEWNVPPKFFLTCTCGYKATAKRSQKALAGVLIWHVGKVLGAREESPVNMRRNGL